MKKILLSAILIIGFGIYAFTQHKSAVVSNVPVVIPDNSQPPAGSSAPNPANSGQANSAGSGSAGGAGSTSAGNTGSGKSTGTGGSGTTTTTTAAKFKNGVYTGPVTDAFYGNVQVQATISGGKLTNVTFLQYPSDRSTSREINGQAMPLLTAEAISAQSANVDIVSGATQTSEAFKQSLAAALFQAKN